MKSIISFTSVFALTASTVLGSPIAVENDALVRRQEPTQDFPLWEYIHKGDDFISLGSDDLGRVRHQPGSTDLSTIILFPTHNDHGRECSLVFNYKSADALSGPTSFNVTVRVGEEASSLTKAKWDNEFGAPLTRVSGIWTVPASQGPATLGFGQATESVKFPCRSSGDEGLQYVGVEVAPLANEEIDLKFERKFWDDTGFFLNVYPLDL